MDLSSISGMTGGTFSPTKMMNSAGLQNMMPDMLEDLNRNSNINPYTSGEMANKIQPPTTQKAGLINPSQGTGFADTLRGFIGEVNGLQKESAAKSEGFIKGEPIELHDVMIASNKAKTSFQLLLELRNKGLELYREVSRMQ